MDASTITIATFFSVASALLGIIILILLGGLYLMNEEFTIGTLGIGQGIETLPELKQFLSRAGTALDILWEENGIELLLKTQRYRPKLFKQLVEELTPRRCLIKILNSSITPLSSELADLALRLSDTLGFANLENKLLEKLFCLCPLDDATLKLIVDRIPSLADHTPQGGFPAVPSLSAKMGNQLRQGDGGIGGLTDGRLPID